MTKKLEDNGLWESSRMMLPEHKKQIIADNHETLYRRPPKPTLDDQEWEHIMRVLMESFGMRTAAQFQLYHPYEECKVIGVVDRVDGYTRTFTVDGERFKLADIIGANAIGERLEWRGQADKAELKKVEEEAKSQLQKFLDANK